MAHAPLRALAASLLIALGGCSPSGPSPSDGSNDADAARSDTVATDTSTSVDTGAPVDSGSDVATDSPGDASADVPVMPGTGCTGRVYLYCEDFESAAPGALPAGWSIDRGWQPGDPAVTADQHHSGSRALRAASATMGQNRARTTFDAALGTARGQHWGRVFYRVATPAFMPSSGVVHNTLVALLGAGELRVVDTVVNTAGAHQFLLNVPDDSCCVGSRYDYRSYDGAWHCAEWQIDQATQRYRFYYDGTEVSDIAFPRSAGETRRPIEVFTGIAVGWRNYQTAATPYEAYFDDLAIHSERIGCD